MKIDRLVRVTKKRIATVHRQPSWNGSLVRKRDSQRSSSWSSIREHCPCYWNRNWRSYWWDSRTDFWEIWKKKDSKWFTITPHCAHRSDGLCAIFPLSLKTTHLTHWKPLRMAQMISEAVNRYAAGCLASGFSAIHNCQKNKKYDFHENGERAGNLLPNRESVGESIRAQPWPGSKGMKSLCKDLDKRQSAKRLYIHQVALCLWIYAPFLPFMEKRLKYALLLFWFYKFRSQSQLTCLV